MDGRREIEAVRRDVDSSERLRAVLTGYPDFFDVVEREVSRQPQHHVLNLRAVRRIFKIRRIGFGRNETVKPET